MHPYDNKTVSSTIEPSLTQSGSNSSIEPIPPETVVYNKNSLAEKSFSNFT